MYVSSQNYYSKRKVCDEIVGGVTGSDEQDVYLGWGDKKWILLQNLAEVCVLPHERQRTN